MTALSKRKTQLTFETDATSRYRGKERAIIVEPDRNGHLTSLRLKGTRVRYEVSWRGVFDFAAKITVEKQRAERRAARKRTKHELPK